MKQINGQEAMNAIADAGWRTEFSAYDEGVVSVFLDEYDEPVAALRWNDNNAAGISFFETRYQGSGIGSAVIEALKVEVAGLHVSGDIDNEDCARFWARHGFDVTGVQVVRE